MARSGEGKLQVALLFGGPSGERDISAGSLKPWVTYLAEDARFELAVLFLRPDLTVYRLPRRFDHANTCADFERFLEDSDRLTDSAFEALLRDCNLAIPILHGAHGEDGAIQRRFERLGVPYLFSEPSALEISFDKFRTHQRLAAAGLPVPKHRLVEGAADPAELLTWVRRELEPQQVAGRSLLCAVKPARSGSSLGVSLVAETSELEPALELARRFDERVLVEQVLEGTEFSVIVVDDPDGNPRALAPTEVRAGGEVYDTRQKYLHGSGSHLFTPLREARWIDPIRRAAEQAYGELGMRHLARVDGFLCRGEVFVTDVNGISGMGFSSFVFLQTAMVGVSHRRLIERLIQGAVETNLQPREPGATAPGRGRVHLLFGGTTSERQVSRQSGCFAGLCLEAAGYDVHFHLMTTDHRFVEVGLFLALHHDVEEIEALARDADRLAGIRRDAERIGREAGLPGEAREQALFVGLFTDLAGAVEGADSVFLALHGGPGEDGSIQAALEVLGVPFNGCDARTSSLCADKGSLIDHVSAAGLEGVRVPRQRAFDRVELVDWIRRCPERADWDREYEAMCSLLGAQALVAKPRSDGCSTGVKRLDDGQALGSWFRSVAASRSSISAGELGPGSAEVELPVPMPREWLLEEAICDPGDLDSNRSPEARSTPGSAEWFAGRRFVELTCAVVERDGELHCASPTIALAAGSELSLAEKFQQGVGTNLFLGAYLPPVRLATVQRRVEAIAEAAGVQGYARIDCFCDLRDDSLVLIEINTIPGMTEATVLYPQVADAFGWSPPQLLTHLLEVGASRAAQHW